MNSATEGNWLARNARLAMLGLVAAGGLALGLVLGLLIQSHRLPAGGASPSASALPDFPLTKGARWTYQGKRRYQQDQQVKEIPLSVEVNVLEATKGDNGAALYEMEGCWDDALSDLALPSRYGLLLAAGKLFRISDQDLPAAKQALTGDGVIPPEVFDKAELLMEFPLRAGQRFGPPEQLCRTDGLYTWNVSPAPQAGQGTFELSLRTLSDEQTLVFRPGAGVSSWRYRHHGTLDEASLELVEYRKDK